MLLAFLLFYASATASAAINSRSNLFLQMMVTMMEIMGLINRDDDYYNQSYPSYGNMAYPQLPFNNQMQALAMQQMLGGSNPALYGSGMMPGGSTLPYTGGNQAVIPFLPDYVNNQGKKKKPHWIEGKWRASDGMIMEVHHGYFKMYYQQNPQQVRGGLVRIKDRWLAIYEKSRNITRQYEFGYKENMLVLKDTSGNMMLFKRMTNWSNPLR